MISNEELTLSLFRNIDETKTQKFLEEEVNISIVKSLIDKVFVKIKNFFLNKNQYSYLLAVEVFCEKLKLLEKSIERRETEYIPFVQELEVLKGKA